MSGCRSCSGRLFHRVGPAVAKQWSPNWLSVSDKSDSVNERTKEISELMKLHIQGVWQNADAFINLLIVGWWFQRGWSKRKERPLHWCSECHPCRCGGRYCAGRRSRPYTMYPGTWWTQSSKWGPENRWELCLNFNVLDYYLHQEGFVLPSVRFSVCLSVCLSFSNFMWNFWSASSWKVYHSVSK